MDCRRSLRRWTVLVALVAGGIIGANAAGAAAPGDGNVDDGCRGPLETKCGKYCCDKAKGMCCNPDFEKKGRDYCYNCKKATIPT